MWQLQAGVAATGSREDGLKHVVLDKPGGTSLGVSEQWRWGGEREGSFDDGVIGRTCVSEALRSTA